MIPIKRVTVVCVGMINNCNVAYAELSNCQVYEHSNWYYP